ncbi:MAG TPA: ABC transporter permease subunit [Candidatus Saccharimonadaceae bacterium]|nr:ABC transporter permease subunit [Candidatus Saccharimonadaceae bacterium]
MTRRSIGQTLAGFGFRQTLRGALIVGLIGGVIMGAQGAAYAAAFPSTASRAKLVSSLDAVPAFNFLSGEVKNAAQPDSYAIYKALPGMVLVTSIWGLMVATRLLRGNEEDGRMELLESGQVTRRQASGWLLVGFGGSIVLAMLVMTVCLAVLGAMPSVKLSLGASVLTTLAAFLPGFVFASVGVLTSQLALTRGKAVIYGLVPLLIFFVVRGVGNTTSSYDWMKSISPFGWSDRLNPVLAPQVAWLLPPVLLVIACAGIGMWLVGRRDYGASIMRQSRGAHSHGALLGSPLFFAVRQNIWMLVWWLLGTVAFTAFMAAVAGKVADIAGDSSSAQSVLARIAPGEIKVAFLGFDTMILALIMAALTIVMAAVLRRDEARGYLDNFLVRKVRRTSWLLGRLGLIIISVVVVALIATLAMRWVAAAQAIDVQLSTMLGGVVALIGTTMTVLGIGTLLYGLWPRLASAGMIVVVGWAFVESIIKDVFHLPDWLEKTSLLTYVPVLPTKSPDWPEVVWLYVIGVVLVAGGVFAFTHRDIVAE